MAFDPDKFFGTDTSTEKFDPEKFFNEKEPSAVQKRLSLWEQARKRYQERGPEEAIGSTEGAGLMEGLAAYDQASGGEIVGGIKDIAQGNIAKGAHRMITGAGTGVMAPAAPFLIPGAIAAPVATAGTIAGGAIVGKGAKKLAETFGATPDQADVAEDIGSIVGGAPGLVKGVKGIMGLKGKVAPIPKETKQWMTLDTSPVALEYSHATGGQLPVKQRGTFVSAAKEATPVEPQLSLTQKLQGFFKAAANQSFPRTTMLNQPAGELMARYAASRTAAPFKADLFVEDVLQNSKIDPTKFQAALTEDNLRSIKQGFIESGDTQAAANVRSIIGSKRSPFKNEADYQKFLNDNETKTVVARYKSLWDQVVEPMFKKAAGIDPTTDLPSRGLQTGARTNLKALREDEPTSHPNNLVSTGSGSLTATFKRKSPFARQAFGTGEAYNVNFKDAMSNTFGRQLEIANKNTLDDHMIQNGLAVMGPPGQKPVMPNGEPTFGFPIRRGGNAQNIYVRQSIAREYGRAADIYRERPPETLSKITGQLNKLALWGLTDVTYHLSNLSTALFTRPGISSGLLSDTLLSVIPGRPDALINLGKAVVKSFQDNKAQLTELAEIGALRPERTQTGLTKPGGIVIKKMDRVTRLLLDDGRKRLVDAGIADASETARREFVNQVGQYNHKMQNFLVRYARESGFGPFATAGTTFNVLGVRTAMLSPGIKATSGAAAVALRLNALAKWVGTLSTIGLANYLITGKLAGRPGTPFGKIDLGRDDKNGRMLSIDVMGALGQGRALRVTGARGAIEAWKSGLPHQDVIDSAFRDQVNSWINPFAGPPIRFASAIVDQPLGIGIPKPSMAGPLVASPEDSQALTHITNSLINSNPIAASIADYAKTGGSISAAVNRQLPRFSPQVGRTEEMTSKYPEIVHKAKTRDYTEHLIYMARRMEPAERSKFLRNAIESQPLEDQAMIQRQLKYSKIDY